MSFCPSRTGSPWADRIRQIAADCDVFIALIGEGYEASSWCREEMKIALGRPAEPHGIEQGPVIVIAQHAHAEAHGQVDALDRVGTIADDVPQAEDRVNPELLHVGKHRNQRPFQCFVDRALSVHRQARLQEQGKT